ncbi:MAG: sulfurtransferase-like selenium metabolism protein YedF [Bacteroidales bacterium]
MQIIDTRGKLCPQPLMMTKRAIEAAHVGDELTVLTNNEIACSNLADYLTELGITFTSSSDGSESKFHFVIPETSDKPIACDCMPEALKEGYIVVIKSDKMGEGDEALGSLLLRAFMNSLIEAPQLPRAIIMYNSGVKIAIRHTDTALSLEKLEEKGVTVIACGTCVDFYEIKDQLAVGIISNMYKITEMLTGTSHLIYP